MKIIGIIVATVWEARPLVSALHLKSAGAGLFEGEFPDGRIVLSVSGMGQDRARQAALAMSRKNLSLMISSGYCGSLRPGLLAGNLALDDTRSDAAWVDSIKEIAQTQNLRLHRGAFSSGASVLMTAADKSRAAADSGAIAADMESAAICDVCLDAKIPFGSIRAVSDEADQDLPASVQFINHEGRPTSRFWTSILTRPQDWAGLIRMHRSSRKADAALAKIFSAFMRNHTLGGLHVQP